MLVAYITLHGNTREAFDFYSNALNGRIASVSTFGDSPGGSQMPEADRNKIMHIALEAPHGIRLMGNDHMDFMGGPFRQGNNFSLSLHPDTNELADEFFSKLSEGGTVLVPLATAPWGDYFGMFMDRFGMKWMINKAGE